VVNTRVTLATGTAERDAAIEMMKQIPGGSKRVTLGADRGSDGVARMKNITANSSPACAFTKLPTS
jgi:hypothetical protein